MTSQNMLRLLAVVGLLGLAAAAIGAARAPLASGPPLHCAFPPRQAQADAGVVWSPDGRRVAFLRYPARGGAGHVVTANADGSQARVLVANVTGYALDWSRDGRIAFSRDGDIWVVPSGGGSRPTLLIDDASAYEPAFSPDAQRIAYTTRGAIWVAAANGSGARELVSIDGSVGAPVWRRDGRAIAFQGAARDASGLFQIFAVDADGSNLRQVTSHPGGAAEPAWSPDGGRLAFASVGRIWLADLGSGAVRPVTPPGGRAYDTQRYSPAWSPRGDELAYSAYRPDDAERELFPDEIRARRVDGGRERRITRPCAVGTPEADVMRGTELVDVVYGIGGSDRLLGGPGNDRLHGGSGRDVVLGGPGADAVIADDGERDRIACGPGRDVALVDRRDIVSGDCERVRRPPGR